jgi:hypothetical protein
MRLEKVYELLKEQETDSEANNKYVMLVKKFREAGSVITRRESCCGGKRSAIDNASIGTEFYKILQSTKLYQSCMSKELVEKRTSFLVTFSDSAMLETYIYVRNYFSKLYYAEYTPVKSICSGT